MPRSTQHQRNLVTVTVGPGSETGLYYIVVANLAHKTTRHELKDFASQACEVDHTEVYQPTSGFVRVKGRANFEQAFDYLNGNMLHYRALQADARNMSQPTVVKLLPTDHHAAKIIRGEPGRVWSELSSPTAGPEYRNDPLIQEADAGMGSPYLDAPGSTSPVFSMPSSTNTHWGYLASPPYAAIETYQPSPASALPPPTAYPVATPSDHGFIQPVAASNSHPAVAAYQVTVTSPTSPPTHYQYATSAAYYPSIPAYDLGQQQQPQQQQQQQQQGYAGYPRQTSLASPQAAYAVDSWPPSHLTTPPEIPAVRGEMMAEINMHATTSGSSSNKEGRKRGPAVKASRSGAAQGQGQGQGPSQSRARGSGSGSRSGGAAVQQPPVFVPPSGPALASVGGGAGRNMAREEPPVIVNGSGVGGGGGAVRKERTPLVVDGSAPGKRAGGGHRGSRH